MAQSTAQSAAEQHTVAALSLLGHTVTTPIPAARRLTGSVQKVDFGTSGPTLTVSGQARDQPDERHRGLMSPAVPNPALIPPGAIAPAPVATPAPGAAPAAAPVRGPSFAEVLAQQSADGRAAAVLAPRARASAAARDRARRADARPSHRRRRPRGRTRASRDSVVFVDGTAFVVSVRNNTVITAVGLRAHARARVHQHRQCRDRMSAAAANNHGRTSPRRPRKEVMSR